MRKIKSTLAVTVCMTAAAALVSAMPAQAGSPKPLDVLASAANVYASDHLMQIYEKADIDGVVIIRGGTDYGETLHPSIDQLKTLGYLPAGFSGGDVRLDFSPVGCLNAKDADCAILVHAAAEGRENVYSIPIRVLPDKDDNPAQ